MSESLKELRERIQVSPRPRDTWYSRVVVRRISIYFTVFFARVGASPSFVTFLSVLAGLLGAFCLWLAWWGWGFFWVHVWYLLDHVDDELGRLRQDTSVTNAYFDIVADAIVPPFFFLALGVGLRLHTERELPFFLGIVASYASMMVLMIAHCESTVLLRSGKGSMPASGSREHSARLEVRLRLIVASLQAAMAFPVFFPAATAMLLIVSFVLPEAAPLFLTTSLLVYAFLVTVVWVTTLAQSVWAKGLDRRHADQ